MKYTLYELICPLSKEEYPYNVKYVGKTTLKGIKRLVYHLSESCRNRVEKNINEEKDKWLRNLVENHSVIPIYKIINKEVSKKDITTIESNRIKYLINNGVKIYNIVYNDDLENPRVKDSRSRKVGTKTKCIYLFNLDLKLKRKVASIEEFCKEFNVGKAQFHFIMKNKLILHDTYILSYKSSITIDDIKESAYKKSKISCWSVKTRKRIKFFSGTPEAAEELGKGLNTIKKAIKEGRVFQNKYLLTHGDSVPIFKKNYNVYKDNILIDNFYTVPEVARFCGVFTHTIINYLCGHIKNCNGFHIEKTI